MSALDLSELLGPGTAVSTAVQQVMSPGASAAASGGVAYDGARKANRLAMWRPPLRSADADLLPEKSPLDARIRDTLRNDAYVAGGSAIFKDSIVGSRYLLNSKPETAVLWGKEDEKWETEFQEEVESKFMLWAESPQNWVDAARRNSFTSHIRLAVGMDLSGGEVLALANWMPGDGRPYRVALQFIDPDRLSTPYDRAVSVRIRNGVELDRRGAPIAYYIRNSHPSEGPFFDYTDLNATKWARIPARKSWGRQIVLHLFEQMRPDQSRGISTIATALSEMRMMKHFRQTELERAVVAATYAASIESELPQDVAAALGAGAPQDGNATEQWVKDYLNLLTEYSSGARNLHMDGAKIPIFAPGTHLKIQNPGAEGPVGDKFEQSLLRYIAAALNVSYEQLSRDYTQTNYSSARAAMGETQKTMAARKKMTADATADFTYRLWLEEAINYNQIEALKRRNVPKFYEGLNAEAYCACEWIGAGQGQIDPLKETQAAILKVKSGFSTKETEIARMSGGDWRKIARQIQREREVDAYYGNPSIYDSTDTTDLENSLTAKPREGGEA